MASAERAFSSALFGFLRELRENNDRAWFSANRARYQDVVQEPALEFIQRFAPELRRISPHFRADPRPVGGSLFRIHRDVRFSKDKSPYKTSVGIHFRHAAARDAHAPGFYLHLEPGESFVGVGIWRPDSAAARKVREAIGADPKRWRAATRGKAFAGAFRFGGESLKRPPAGFDPDHPLIDDLKRKDFIAMAPLSQRAVTSERFLGEFSSLCGTGSPFVRLLCEALDVPF